MLRLFAPFFLVAMVAAAIFWGAPTHAATPPAEPALPAPLQKMKDEGVAMKYLGRDLGYDGWIAVENGQEQYFYVTPDGSAFFLGILFNKNGRAITYDQLLRLKGKNDPILQDLMNAPSQRLETTVPTTVSATPPSPDKSFDKPAATPTSAGERLLADAAGASGLTLGDPASTAPIIYSFIDPLCPHCKDMLKALTPAVAAGKVRVRVIPVGAVAPDSRALAATLMADPDGAKRLMQIVAGDKAALTPAANASATAVDANLKLLTQWQFSATPVTVYRGRAGAVKLIEGAPKDVNALISDLP